MSTRTSPVIYYTVRTGTVVVSSTVQLHTYSTNIINSFGYGYKFKRAFKSSNGYKFNGMLVDLNKSLIKQGDEVNSIIFYSNLNWSGKLNLTICS